MFGMNIGRPGVVGNNNLSGQVAALFSSGEQGAWYDPSDFSTLFQDSAGTTPVTVVGQPVGKMLDKSGRGNHASQSTAANRPVLQQDGGGRYYLAFNGTNSSMSTAAIDFTATDKMTVWAGVRKLTDGVQAILELGSLPPVNPGFGLVVINGGFLENTLFGSSRCSVNGTVPTGIYKFVTTIAHDIGAAAGQLTEIPIFNLQGGAATRNPTATNDAGTGNFPSAPIYIGSRNNASMFFNGNLYQLIIRGAASSAGQISSAETFVNTKTGAY